MIKNIIFDLGGVVVDYDPKAYLYRQFNDPELEELLYNVIFGSEEWKQLDAGTITRALAEQRMLAAAGRRRYEAQLVLDDWREMMTTRLDTVELITGLKAAGYHIYFLSNLPEDVYQLFTERRRFMQLFEGGIPSFSVKLTKPNRKIFDLMLKTYGLRPEETIFVDDGKENIATAQKLGLTAIPFKDAMDLHKTLGFSRRGGAGKAAPRPPAESAEKNRPLAAPKKARRGPGGRRPGRRRLLRPSTCPWRTTMRTTTSETGAGAVHRQQRG